MLRLSILEIHSRSRSTTVHVWLHWAVVSVLDKTPPADHSTTQGTHSPDAGRQSRTPATHVGCRITRSSVGDSQVQRRNDAETAYGDPVPAIRPDRWCTGSQKWRRSCSARTQSRDCWAVSLVLQSSTDMSHCSHHSASFTQLFVSVVSTKVGHDVIT